jgi:hypothetical protein
MRRIDCDRTLGRFGFVAQTIVDRCNQSTSSATAELMIENAAAKMPKPPTIIALDSLTRYNSFRPSPEVRCATHFHRATDGLRDAAAAGELPAG